MLECSEGDNVGKTKQLKQKLQEHCKQQPHIFVNFEGHEDVVRFRNVVEYTINENYNPLRTALKTKPSELYKMSQKLYMMKF